MKHPELKTIRDYIRYAASCFNEASLYFGHGTTDAWAEAERLVLHTIHLPLHCCADVLDANLTKREQLKLLQLIDLRVSKRIPVPYLTHQAWFCGLPFYVDERVLIPRSSIAELIDNNFQPWALPEEIHDILDLCTGSGCIAIACAKAFPHASIDASDVSPDALAVAKINTLKHAVEDRVHLYQSDLFANLAQKQYDLIVTNPPYVNAEEMAGLPTEYTHEPILGLSGGTKGLDFVVRILSEAVSYIKPEGILVVEVGNAEEALVHAYPDVPFTWIDFDHSEGGVFLLTGEQLTDYFSKKPTPVN